MHNKKCIDTNKDINLALLQICSTPVGTGLHSLAVMLFNRPIHGFLPQMKREPIGIDNDDVQYQALEACQNKYNQHDDTCKNPIFSTGFTVAVQWEDWGHGHTVEPNRSDQRGHV